MRGFTAPTPAASSPPPPRPRDWAALAVLTLAVTLLAVDATVLSLAIPSLSADLAPSAGQLLWIGDVYSFVLAGLLVTMGNVADRIGRRRLPVPGHPGRRRRPRRRRPGGPVRPGTARLHGAMQITALIAVALLLLAAVMAWRYVPAGDPDPADPPVHGTMGP